MIPYFYKDEDFSIIIKSILKDMKINKIKYITNGWTNFVFQVYTDNGQYFFRFPRDKFWAKAIVKECIFSKYIKGKTNYNTVELELHTDNKKRYFSVHRKVEGTALADVMDKLSDSEIKKVSYQISDFMFQLHNIKIEKDLYDLNIYDLKLVDFLNELLTCHIEKKEKSFWKMNERVQDECNNLVHGDLNSSNILLDKNKNISGIIDWSFGGISNKYYDIARIIGRCPQSFKDEIIKSYEEIEKKNLNLPELNNKIVLWKNIDNSYINYMKKVGII